MSLCKERKVLGWQCALQDQILVAKSYAQRESIYYNEVFSPVVKYSSILILLAPGAQYDYELDQLDVKTAFLHGNLEEIYNDTTV